jgi:flagellar P-ring protein precursor FlgI
MTIKVSAAILAGLMFIAGAAAPAWATSRIKDLANVEGVRQNQLIGYGLVVGLNGTGDTLNKSLYQAIAAGDAGRLGVNVRGAQMHGNVAAVMVTANLPAFATRARAWTSPSRRSAFKACKAARFWSPLLGADGNVCAVAQGSLAIRLQAEGVPPDRARRADRGRMSNGAIIEREIEFALNKLGQLRLALRNPDFHRQTHRLRDPRFHRLASRRAARPRRCRSPSRRTSRAT